MGWAHAAYAALIGQPSPPSTPDVPPGIEGLHVRVARAAEALGECKVATDGLFKALASAEAVSRQKVRYPESSPS